MLYATEYLHLKVNDDDDLYVGTQNNGISALVGRW